MMPAALRCPAYETDDRQVGAATAALRCSPRGSSDLARVTHITPQRASQLYAGDRSGFFYRAMEGVDDLARGEHTTPWPFITSLRIIAMQRANEDKAEADLRARYAELLRMDAAVQERLETARRFRNGAALTQALQESAEIREEMVSNRRLCHMLPGKPDPEAWT